MRPSAVLGSEVLRVSERLQRALVRRVADRPDAEDAPARSVAMVRTKPPAPSAAMLSAPAAAGAQTGMSVVIFTGFSAKLELTERTPGRWSSTFLRKRS